MTSHFLHLLLCTEVSLRFFFVSREKNLIIKDHPKITHLKPNRTESTVKKIPTRERDV